MIFVIKSQIFFFFLVEKKQNEGMTQKKKAMSLKILGYSVTDLQVLCYPQCSEHLR